MQDTLEVHGKPFDARVFTRAQDADRQIRGLLAAGVRRDDLYVDHGLSGARTSSPAFFRALDALHEGDTLVITLDRLGRSTVNMLALSRQLRASKDASAATCQKGQSKDGWLVQADWRGLAGILLETSGTSVSSPEQSVPAGSIKVGQPPRSMSSPTWEDVEDQANR